MLGGYGTLTQFQQSVAGEQIILYSKAVLSGHSNRSELSFQDRLSLNADRSIAECSEGAFCNTFDLH